MSTKTIQGELHSVLILKGATRWVNLWFDPYFLQRPISEVNQLGPF